MAYDRDAMHKARNKKNGIVIADLIDADIGCHICPESVVKIIGTWSAFDGSKYTSYKCTGHWCKSEFSLALNN